MKRILLYSSGIIAEKKPTGGELRFLELADYLNHQPNADLCCADADSELAPLGLNARFHMQHAGAAPAFLPEEARILLTNRALLRCIASDKYDAVIAFDVPPAIGLVVSGVRNIVLMVRKDLIGYERVKSSAAGLKKSFRISYQWLCETVCMLAAKQVICQCAYDRDAIMKRHPLNKGLRKKISVQINNVNPSWIERRAENAQPFLRKTDLFRVCFIGGFDDLRKGQEIFLDAAKILTDQNCKIEFILVGGGKNLQRYRCLYEAENIHFLGRMDNPISALMSCDLLVVPSLADSCPNTVMEALFVGVPVIGSNAGGIPDILRNDDALFEPEKEQLSKRIKYFCQDRAAYNQLREQQKERREELTFDWAETIVNLIQKN